jgi:hypothetical protein
MLEDVHKGRDARGGECLSVSTLLEAGTSRDRQKTQRAERRQSRVGSVVSSFTASDPLCAASCTKALLARQIAASPRGPPEALSAEFESVSLQRRVVCRPEEVGRIRVIPRTARSGSFYDTKGGKWRHKARLSWPGESALLNRRGKPRVSTLRGHCAPWGNARRPLRCVCEGRGKRWEWIRRLDVLFRREDEARHLGGGEDLKGVHAVVRACIAPPGRHAVLLPEGSYWVGKEHLRTAKEGRGPLIETDYGATRSRPCFLLPVQPILGNSSAFEAVAEASRISLHTE